MVGLGAKGRSWNAAYDIWFNNSDYELMIWMQWQIRGLWEIA
jgi:hypothetical protein